MYSTTHNVYPDSAYRQMPLRISESLMNELDQLSRMTRIPKSEICREGVEQFVKQMKHSDAVTQLQRMFR